MFIYIVVADIEAPGRRVNWKIAEAVEEDMVKLSPCEAMPTI
jgi:hypothetical protein